MKRRTAFEVFKSYFNKDQNKFNTFLNKLSQEKQEKFFKLSTFYRNFVKQPPMKVDFMRDCFSLLMIFSLIEALMEDIKYLTFPEFLSKNFEQIMTKEELKKKEEKYYNQFGSIRRAKRFFNDYVDDDCKKIFVYAVRRRNMKKRKRFNEDKIIERNIILFYKWRSSFVHSAGIPEAFRNYGIFKTGKEVYSIPYKREDFQLLFEHGFLRYFGFRDNFEHGDVERKIEKHKKHTGVKIIWE